VPHDGTGIVRLKVTVDDYCHLDRRAASDVDRLAAPEEHELTRCRSAEHDVYVPPASSRGSPSPCVCFSVLDNGCGIEEEELGRVFKAFEQLQAGVAYKGARQ
jgi:signal transduction histidine kinase